MLTFHKGFYTELQSLLPPIFIFSHAFDLVTVWWWLFLRVRGFGENVLTTYSLLALFFFFFSVDHVAHTYSTL